MRTVLRESPSGYIKKPSVSIQTRMEINLEICTFVAPCLFGLEKLLGEEIDALGYKRLQTIDGRVTFRAPLEEIPRMNIELRFAERVLIELGSFRAETFTDLYEGVRELPWEDWIAQPDAFPVKGHSVKSKLFSIPDCQKIVKKAIVDRLSDQYGILHFEESDVTYQVEFFLLRDTASLMIDTTGIPLHKRGYRPQTVTAPLRETLAAAMVRLARPREDVLLWDPFCGSGTIAIEAALMMTHTAPGLNRSFAAETFPQIPARLWRDARDAARANIIETGFEAYASDLDPQCVRIAADTVKRAGMSRYIKVFQKDALTITTENRRGTIVCNPPYGERLLTLRQAEELYRAMGKHFRTLDAWQIYVLTSHEDFQRLYGRRADKVRRLYNGMIRCNYYQFFRRLNDGQNDKQQD